MEHMDIDSIVYVPDTPDRLAARETKFKSSIDVPDSPDTQVVGDKVNSCNDKDSIGMRANENGIRKHCMRPPRRHHGSSSAAPPGNSSSKITFVTKRHDPSHESSHNQSSKSEKIRNGISYVPREGAVEGPTEQHCHGNKGKKVVSLGGIQIIENGKRMLSDKGKKAVSSGSSQIVENGKNFLSAAQLHSQQSVADSRLVSRINNGMGNNSTVSAFDRGKGVESNAVTQPKVGQFGSASFSSPRNTGQKRLVRNGCISPCNVAKAKKDLGKDTNGKIDEGPSHVSSSRTQAGVHSKAQASNVSNKGKGIIPLSNEESGVQNANDRDTVSINEILEEDDDDSIMGILSGGWRCTHNRSKKTHSSSSSEVHQLLPVDSPLPLRQRLRPVDHTSTLSGDDSPLPLRQRLRPVSQSNQHDRDHPVTDMNRKRQKQGSSSSTQDVRSQNTSDNSGIVFLGSSGDSTIESRPTRTRRRNNAARVAELDGASSSNSVDPAMTRQMEADEILARELQEQLYNEELGLRFGEIDVHERLDLQHENVLPAPPRRTRQASTARTVSTGIPSRAPRARTNTNFSRTLHETRVMLQNRMRLRNRFPGRPRAISSSSRDVSTLFPSEMDVELRMTILEALEEFNDMGVDNSLLQIHREFNENDYEMLLGLDENNHRHSGASNRRINELPQTTLENDLEEACAVCLEAPTTGDTIRHLPCFHKFHKDCIDPWLTRKSSCPVCKNSIT